jgi:hypothetical protein
MRRLGKRGDIVIQQSADALDQTQFAAERDLVVTLLNRHTEMSRRVKARTWPHGRRHIWDLPNLRGFNQREALAGSAVGGVVPALPG